jgi:hypothetical protein
MPCGAGRAAARAAVQRSRTPQNLDGFAGARCGLGLVALAADAMDNECCNSRRGAVVIMPISIVGAASSPNISPAPIAAASYAALAKRLSFIEIAAFLRIAKASGFLPQFL